MMTGVFNLININVKYCTENINLKNYISANNHIESTCEDICFKENIKIDIKDMNMNMIIYVMVNVLQIHMLYFVKGMDVKKKQKNVLIKNLKVII